MIKKILVGYDGSEPATKAFEFGLDMAGRYGAEFVVLSVVRPPEPPEAVEMEAILEQATEHYEQLFGVLKAKAGAANVAVACEVRVGHPAEQIIHYANENGVDVIVLGHRGKSAIAKWLLGSISRRVVSYAKSTVIITR